MTVNVHDMKGETLFTIGMGTIVSVLLVLITALGGVCANLYVRSTDNAQNIAVLKTVDAQFTAAMAKVESSITCLSTKQEEQLKMLTEIRADQKRREVKEKH